MSVKLRLTTKSIDIYKDFNEKNIKSYAISSHGSYPSDLGAVVPALFTVPDNVYIAFSAAPSELCISNIDKYVYKYFRTPKFMVAAIANPDIEEAKVKTSEEVYIPAFNGHYLQPTFTKSSAFVRAARTFHFCIPGQECPNMLLDFTDEDAPFESRLFDLQSHKKGKKSLVTEVMDSRFILHTVMLQDYIRALLNIHEHLYDTRPLVVYIIACGADLLLPTPIRETITKTFYKNDNEFKSYLVHFLDIKIPKSYFKEKSEDIFLYHDIRELIDVVIELQEEPYMSKLEIAYDESVGSPYIIVYDKDKKIMDRTYITLGYFYKGKPYVKVNIANITIPDDILKDVVQYIYNLFYNAFMTEFDFYFVYKDVASNRPQSIIIENGEYINSRTKALTRQQTMRTRPNKPSSYNSTGEHAAQPLIPLNPSAAAAPPNTITGGGGSNRIRLHHRKLFTVKRKRRT